MPHVPKPTGSAGKSESSATDRSTPATGPSRTNSPGRHAASATSSSTGGPGEVGQDSSIALDQDSKTLSAAEASRHVFSMQELTDAELLRLIRAIPVGEGEENLPRVEVNGGDGQHGALMRIDHPVRLRVHGSLGDYAFAFNSRAIVKLYGNSGHGLGEGLSGGSVRVRGDAGHGVGTAMTGGTLGVYGSAGDRAGGFMRGGGLFVRGDVGNDVGIGAIAGTIVIGGDAGENIGDPLSNVAVFIRGRASSLADGVTETTLRKKQEVQLGLLLISAGIRGDAKDFRRIVPLAKLEAENAARGEIVPNWR
jgi:glutamate synthase domain-containing protein 3